MAEENGVGMVLLDLRSLDEPTHRTTVTVAEDLCARGWGDTPGRVLLRQGATISVAVLHSRWRAGTIDNLVKVSNITEAGELTTPTSRQRRGWRQRFIGMRQRLTGALASILA